MSAEYIFSTYCGDTYLDIYGYIDKDEPSLGHVGGVEVEDIKIADTDISVLEMVYWLNSEKIDKIIQEKYADWQLQ